jgi:UDP-glucuronate 4-epimerase
MKTLLVTGCAGFIGFHATRYLLDSRVLVVGIDNLNNYYDPKLKIDRLNILKKYKNFVFYNIDISDEEKMDNVFVRHKIEVVCHLAAQAGVRYSLKEPLQYVKTNIYGFVVLLESMRKSGVKKLVYASSSSVYGENKTKGGFIENEHCNSPVSLYAATKRSNELLAYVYHSLYSFRCTGIRFFSVYGPWGRPDMAYFNFTKAILENKTISIFNFGKSKRDFTYIDDVIPCLANSIKRTLSWEIINLGNSKPITTIELIKTLEKGLGKKAKIKFVPQQAGEVSITYANTEVARRIFGYQPKTQISEGLKLFIDWYKKYYHKK